jgi:hypothetical protein
MTSTLENYIYDVRYCQITVQPCEDGFNYLGKLQAIYLRLLLPCTTNAYGSTYLPFYSSLLNIHDLIYYYCNKPIPISVPTLASLFILLSNLKPIIFFLLIYIIFVHRRSLVSYYLFSSYTY